MNILNYIDQEGVKMEEIKTELNELISGGKIRKALKTLQLLELDSAKKDKIAAISARYNRFVEEKNQGLLTHEQASVTENRIINSLIEVVNNLDKKEIKLPQDGRNKPLKYALIAVAGLIVVIIALFQFNLLGSAGSEKLQLTVFVQDENGNPVLANEGKLNIPLGNRSLNSIIGPNGRTNFADITGDNVGDSITIGLDAQGWEVVNGKNKYLFNGEPITLVVTKDASLGIIKGVVKSRDGQEFIKDALISIGADTVINSNSAGIFNAILPTHMRVKSESTPYNLSISAPGYKTATQYYYPGQPIEIRLNKK